MPAINPATASAATISSLLNKLTDPDPDFRYMSLNDLHNVLVQGRPELLASDFNVANKTVDALVRSLDDTNGEVQNLAIKCLGPLSSRLASTSAAVGALMEKLTTLRLKDSIDHTVPAMAIKSVVSALPPAVAGEPVTKDVSDSYLVISRVVIPRFIGKPPTGSYRAIANASTRGANGASESILDITNEPIVETLDVLIEVVRCFGPALQSYEAEALFDAVVSVLHNEKASSATKKRAVVAASSLAVCLPDGQFTAFIQRATAALRQGHAGTQRLYISILGSMARSIPHRFGSHIGDVAPYVIGELDEAKLDAQLEAVGEGNDQGDFNDVREAALVALEAFLASCPHQMRPYTDEAMQACLRYVKYDPNYVDDDDDADDAADADDDDFGDDDDEFGGDAGFDDDDDPSWKVRRCAAKAIHTLISTRSSGDLLESGVLYRDAAPLLIKRFGEREEAVRLEVIAAMALLVRKTGEGVLPSFDASNDNDNDAGLAAPPSRKRRRQSSVTAPPAPPLASPADRKPSVPTTGPRADLAAQTPAIVAATVKALKGKQIPTKQAVLSLLDDMVGVQRGGLSEYFDQVMRLVVDTIQSPTGATASSTLTAVGGNSAATPVTLRIAGLHLLGHIAKTHSAQSLQPYLTHIVDVVLLVMADRFYKLSSEAVSTSEEVIKATTPPRSSAAAKSKADLQRLYGALVERLASPNVDAEVRQKAIQALGTLLSRTGVDGGHILPLAERTKALDSLAGLLANETSRLAAARAIHTVAAAATGAIPFDGAWARGVAAHLASQLSKASNAVRGSCAQALLSLVQSPAAQGTLDDATTSLVVAALHPVIVRNDQWLLTPALRILAVLEAQTPQVATTSGLVSGICALLHTTVSPAVMGPLLELVRVVGRSGNAKPLMQGLLKDVGVVGEPAVVGKVVGSLLVAGGDSSGVSVDSFVKELWASQKDPLRASLALSVLGEAALHLGPASPIEPKLFLDQFGSEYDSVGLTAAVALGRAGAGNVSVYVPVILEGLAPGSSRQGLLLQSIKEVLQQVAVDRVDISAYTSAIWSCLLAAATVENDRAMCAECLGRLAIAAPQTYLYKLQQLLGDTSATVRGLALQALRYALPDTSEAFDATLAEQLVPMLAQALRDDDMEIRRLAMTALNSAVNNKPELVLGHLNELLPFIIEESKPKPGLLREVMMGPFKHIVDDGLEVRKGAYETLYALIETAFGRISIISLFERIIDGLGDDHDVRNMCNLMLARLAYLAPEETARRLDAIADKFRATLSNKLRDNAVKQEIEKQDDANKSVLRTSIVLAERLRGALEGSNSGSGSGSALDAGHPAWALYWDFINKSFERQMQALAAEFKDGMSR